MATASESVLERAAHAPPQEAEALLRAVVNQETGDEDFVRTKELAIYALGELFVKQQRANDVGKLLTEIRPFFDHIPKAKTAKLVRTLLDLVAQVPSSLALQISLCKESIAWCVQEKRTFLRQRIQAKLGALLLESGEYSAALVLISELLREVKRLDDKPLLVEIQLVESRVHHKLHNLPKAKAALTSARTAGNAIYCPPPLQAAIDTQAGTLHAEEKDFKTAGSYFYEAYEAYNSMDDARAVFSLKYMLLCKIMTNSTDDVHALLDGKVAMKFGGDELIAMKSVATAYQHRSLAEFQRALDTYKKELRDDEVVHSHITSLYNNLLEQNLLRLMEPYSRVEIAHIAKKIDLDITVVETKLSQMILDKKFSGILDQGAGCLIVFDEAAEDLTYPSALSTIGHMETVVGALYERAAQL